MAFILLESWHIKPRLTICNPYEYENLLLCRN